MKSLQEILKEKGLAGSQQTDNRATSSTNNQSTSGETLQERLQHNQAQQKYTTQIDTIYALQVAIGDVLQQPQSNRETIFLLKAMRNFFAKSSLNTIVASCTDYLNNTNDKDRAKEVNEWILNSYFSLVNNLSATNFVNKLIAIVNPLLENDKITYILYNSQINNDTSQSFKQENQGYNLDPDLLKSIKNIAKDRSLIKRILEGHINDWAKIDNEGLYNNINNVPLRENPYTYEPDKVDGGKRWGCFFGVPLGIAVFIAVIDIIFRWTAPWSADAWTVAFLSYCWGLFWNRVWWIKALIVLFLAFPLITNWVRDYQNNRYEREERKILQEQQQEIARRRKNYEKALAESKAGYRDFINILN